MAADFLEFARSLHQRVSRLSSSDLWGVPLDAPMHFLGGVVLYLFVRLCGAGRRRAWLILIGIIVAKEAFDILRKSDFLLANVPLAPIVCNTLVDLAMGLLGGGAAALWLSRAARSTSK